MNKTVINKNNGKKYEVIDVTYDKAGYPRFTIYKDNQWVRMSAKHFRPYTTEDWAKEIEDLKKNSTIYFENYDC